MDKRAPLRQFYNTQAEQAKGEQRHKEVMAQLVGSQKTSVAVIKSLISFLDKKTTKTEVLNQLKSISTPDIDKVVQALSKLDADVLSNKLDLSPVLTALTAVKDELAQIPKSLPEFEQRDSVTVSNLGDVTLDTSSLEKAIKALNLKPVIDVKAPVINLKGTDLNPLKAELLNVVKAVKAISFPDSPITNLSFLEKESKAQTKQLEEANKHLKKIVDKPSGGGGGGGGNSTPYVNEQGKAVNVVLVNGVVPTTSEAAQAKKIIVSAALTYIAVAIPGTVQSAASWQVQRIDESVTGTTVITWADGDAHFDNVATDLTALAYA